MPQQHQQPIPEWVRARYSTITDETWAHIQGLVADFDPMTDAERERLRLIFRGT